MQLRLRSLPTVALVAAGALLLPTGSVAAQGDVGGNPNAGGPPPPPAPDDRGLGSTHEPRTREDTLLLETFSWRVYWDVVQEHYFERRAHVHGEADGGDEGFFLGRGEKQQAPRDSRRVTAEDVETSVVPLFKILLEDDTSPEVQAATLIAYARAARVLPLDARADVVEALRPFLADPTRDVSEAATIALGITGHFSAVVALGDLVVDSDAGQGLADDSEVPYRMRAYAAYGLGLSAGEIANEDVRRYAVQKLARGLLADDGRWGDLEVACAIALGMVPLTDDDGRVLEREAAPGPLELRTLADQLAFLLDLGVDEDADRLARCHALSAVGRLTLGVPPPRREALAAELVPPIAALLERSSSAPREAMQGAAQALGNLLDDDDDEASDLGRRALMRSLELHEDTLTHAFALLGLARAAGREGLGREQGIGAAEARTLLLATLQRGDTVRRTWAALALGIHAHDLAEQGRTVPSEVRNALREALKRTDSPEELSAYAIAVGLLGDTVAVERLSRHVVRAQNDLLRGHVTVALGMIGAPESVPVARAGFFDLLDRPAALAPTALGRALLEDPDLVTDLEAVLEEEGSLLGRMAMLFSLGRFGDVRALDTLLSWAAPRAASSELRAVAVASLGMLCEPDAIPWPARIGWQTNPYAETKTLRGSGRGVLDAR